jgi:hypothetical protein
MTRKQAIKLLKSEKKIVALDSASYVMFLQLGLFLLYNGSDKVAKIEKGFGFKEKKNEAAK